MLETIFFAGLGLIIGSFLNVGIIRSNTGRSIMGRSGCMSCGAPLTPRMLIPVLSWVIQGGRCASCGTRVSPQYPLVELLTSALFVAVGMSHLYGISTALALIFAALLVCIVVYDIRHTIIPDIWVYAAALVALALRFSALEQTAFHINDAIVLFLSGPIVAAPLFFLWFVTRGRGIGLGDAKLALAAGYLLGVGYGLIAVMLSFVIGAFVSVFILLPFPTYRRALAYWGILARPPQETFTMKSEVPFGPFLAAGMLLVWFSILFGIDAAAFGWLGLGILAD